VPFTTANTTSFAAKAAFPASEGATTAEGTAVTHAPFAAAPLAATTTATAHTIRATTIAATAVAPANATVHAPASLHHRQRRITNAGPRHCAFA